MNKLNNFWKSHTIKKYKGGRPPNANFHQNNKEKLRFSTENNEISKYFRVIENSPSINVVGFKAPSK